MLLLVKKTKKKNMAWGWIGSKLALRIYALKKKSTALESILVKNLV